MKQTKQSRSMKIAASAGIALISSGSLVLSVPTGAAFADEANDNVQMTDAMPSGNDAEYANQNQKENDASSDDKTDLTQDDQGGNSNRNNANIENDGNEQLLNSNATSASTIEPKVQQPASQSSTRSDETTDANVRTDENAIHVSTAYDLVYNINQAPDGVQTTIVLDDNITNDQYNIWVSSSKSIVLDLNGHTLELASLIGRVSDSESHLQYRSGIQNQGALEIRNGEILDSSICEDRCATIVNFNGTLTLDDTLTVRSATDPDQYFTNKNVIVTIYGNVTSNADIYADNCDIAALIGGKYYMNGGIASTADREFNGSRPCGFELYDRGYNGDSFGSYFEMNGGEINAYTYAVTSNNLLSNDCSVNIYAGTINTEKTAIYMAGNNNFTVLGGGSQAPTITSAGGSGIEICTGSLGINAGTVIHGSSESKAGAYVTDQALLDGYAEHSGTCSAGDAITIIGNRGGNYNKTALDVTINGGTFTSGDNYAIRYMNRVDDVAEDQGVNVTINGGTFEGAIDDIDTSFTGSANKQIVYEGTFKNADLDKIKYLIQDGSSLVWDGDSYTALSRIDAITSVNPYYYVTDNGVSVYFNDYECMNGFLNDKGLTTDNLEITQRTLYIGTGDLDQDYSVQLDHGATVTPSTLTPKEFQGYTFMGWFLDHEYNYPLDSFTITGDMRIEAKYAKNMNVEYIVDGATYETSVIPSGEKLGTIDAPEKEGYKFLGWKQADGSYATNDTIISEDTVLTAEFVKLYTVSFEGNDYDSITIEEGQTIPELPKPSKEGYTFIGWVDDEGNIVKEGDTIKGDVVLTASFEQIVDEPEKDDNTDEDQDHNSNGQDGTNDDNSDDIASDDLDENESPSNEGGDEVNASTESGAEGSEQGSLPKTGDDSTLPIALTIAALASACVCEAARRRGM